MKKILYSALLFTIVTAFTSCQKEEEIGGTVVQKMAGDWYVRLSTDGGKTYDSDYYSFGTYNTAANSTSQMWLDDHESFYEAKGKVNINLDNLTFDGSNIQNEYYDITFNVTGGKIIKSGATAPASGTVTDSITFNMEFSDDPGVIYTLSGYKKTRFLEDEH